MVASLLAMVPEGSEPSTIKAQQDDDRPQGRSEVEEHRRVNPLAHLEQPDLLEDEAARRLKDVLKEIQVFVEKCTEKSNFWQRGWEVVVAQNLPRLKRELFEWVMLCIMNNSVSGYWFKSGLRN